MSTIGSLRTEFKDLIKSLPATRPILKSTLDGLVGPLVERTKSEEKHVEWECVCKREALLLTLNENAALDGEDPQYYQKIFDLLDFTLTLSELKGCDPSLPLLILEDIFETQTVSSCMRIFSWLEERTDRVTVDMHPAKGKGPNLLRSLNNLLRRISKSGDTTQFCGRILIFLSSVFPFGERSGVNLRGEYGAPWTDVSFPAPKTEQVDSMEGVEATLETAGAEPPTPAPAPAADKLAFYNTFWSLQTLFARPQTFVNKEAFSEFKTAAEIVLTSLSEATKADRKMMGGTKAASGTKRKHDETQPNGVAADSIASSAYFFPKFLTSPDLLEFELSDTIFRRQILVQLLILLRHLMTFTAREKEKWVSPRNNSLQMDFTLPDSDDTWVRDIYVKAMAELRSTSPEGNQFADTIALILERDQNWVRWKNEVCPPMDRTAKTARAQEEERNAGKTAEDLEKEEKERWAKLFKRTIPSSEVEDEDPPTPYGSANLEEVWEFNGVRDLADLEDPQEPATLEDLLKQIKMQDARREMLRKRKNLPPRRLPLPQPKSSRASTPMAASTSTGPSAGDQPPAAVSPNLPSGEEAATSSSTMDVDNKTELKPPAAPAATGGATPASPSPGPGTPTTAPSSAPRVVIPAFRLVPQEEDPSLREFDMHKQSLTWLALRLAIREGHLQLFSKINTDDIGLLIEAIKDSAKADEQAKNADNQATVVADPGYDAEPSPAPAPETSAGDVPMSVE